MFYFYLTLKWIFKWQLVLLSFFYVKVIKIRVLENVFLSQLDCLSHPKPIEDIAMGRRIKKKCFFLLKKQTFSHITLKSYD